MIIRRETSSDWSAIRRVNQAAFGGDVEALLIDNLRADGLTSASLVAENGVQGEIVGHIFFSPVEIIGEGETVKLASLAPMAVMPDTQRKGIGKALVRQGIEYCREAGWPAIVVVGHTDYYPRFGFSPETVGHLKSPYAGPAFMGLDLHPGFLAAVSGELKYPEAFKMLQ